jgi:hypothetical protein
MAKAMSDHQITTPSAKGLEASVKAVDTARGLPPIHLWTPPDCGDIDIRIARDGTWYHEGSPIRRPALVRLFASIMRKEGARFVLVTPVEKVGITVEDAPFVALDFDVSGQGADQIITFETNVGDRVSAGPATPLRVAQDGTEPAPYVRVRGELDARIDRKSFYRLVEIGAHHDGWFGVWSGGMFFGMSPSDMLDGA